MEAERVSQADVETRPCAQWRCAAVIGGAAFLTAAFARALYLVLSVNGVTPLQIVFLILSSLAFSWVALGAASAIAGMAALLLGGTPPLSPARRVVGRTALLFPIYHEPPARIAGSIEAMCEDLERLGLADGFDLFVLSDSRNRDVGEQEAAIFRRLAQRLRDRMPLFYRRRPENRGRKAGNIADWVSRFGASYETFVVLDADSVMTGELLGRLTAAMEEQPDVGLLQTVPRLVGAETAFQHLQQLAGDLYGGVAAAGQASWQGEHGNYWGHNAIVRTRAFAMAAGLPELSGRAPFGGPILSHDFVEAALLHRAGWKVVLDPEVDGSYEGSPPTVIEQLSRDRRWMQGNLQHLRIVPAHGLPLVSRLHLAMGAMAFIAPALWGASLVVGVVLALQARQLVPSYFTDAKTLFPVWPVTDPNAALRLLIATLVVVFLPKICGLALRLARSPGDRLRLFAAAGLELVASTLLAPVMMVAQVRALIAILTGQDAGWSPQQRSRTGLSWWSAVRFCRWQLVVGGALLAASSAVDLDMELWMAPVLTGLLLSPLLCLLTCRPASRALSRLLATPEDREPPPVVARADALARTWDAAGRETDGEPASAKRNGAAQAAPSHAM